MRADAYPSLLGDDEAARNRAVDALIQQVCDPSWQSINLTRLDGNDQGQAAQALAEARTPPLGAGDRLVLLQRSPSVTSARPTWPANWRRPWAKSPTTATWCW